MGANVRLTDNMVRKALSPSRGQEILWDTEVKGFGVRLTPQGAKSFVLDYRAGARQRRVTIGAYPDWTVAAARKAAKDLKRDIDGGTDPQNEKKTQRDAPTMRELWGRYKTEWLPQKAKTTQIDEVSIWEKIILPKLGKEKIGEIGPMDIDALHREVTNVRGTPIRANRVVASIRKAYNLAIRWNWTDKNPASGVRKNPEEKRNRYLNKKEIAALALALNEHSERTAANAIKLLMLTGARKSEVTNATWDMFDLENGVWTKPSAHTKQRRLHRVPLSAPAINLLLQIKAEADNAYEKARKKDRTVQKSPYVFPSDVSPDQPIQEIRRTWCAVCKAAGLTDKIPKKNKTGKSIKDKDGNPVLIDWPNVRIHDLRHSFASILVSAGASLPLIGQMLGHTQVQTTQRYAHLYDESLRHAADLVGQAIPLLPTTTKGAKK